MDTWPSLLPTILLATALLVAPGVLVLRAAGVRASMATLFAAPLSVALVVVAGLALALVGARWSLASGVAALGLCTLLAVGVARFVASRTDGGTLDDQPLPWTVAGAVALVGTASAWLTLAAAAERPASIPQMPDVVFHLGAPEWMVRHGSASLLDVTSYAQFDNPLSYPGGWHVLVAALAGWTGQPVVVVSHALLISVVGVVWPLSVIALARVVLGSGVGLALAAGLLAPLFSSFPWRFLAWGPLWPNLLSLSMFPAVTAVALCAVAPAELLADRPLPPARARLLAAVCLVVLAVAQPNAVATGLVAAVCVSWWAIPVWRRGLTGRWRRRLVSRPALVLALVALVAAWTPVIPPNMFITNWQVQVGVGEALVSLVTPVDESPGSATLLGLLVLVGLVVLARSRPTRWVAAFFVVGAALFVALYGVNGGWIRLVTWLWWNDQVRLRAAIVLPALLAAVAATRWLGGVLARHTRGRPGTWTVAIAAAVAVALGVGVPANAVAMRVTYHESSASWSWLRPGEQQALVELAAHVPAGAVVAANPWRGAMFLYPVSGVEMLYPTNYSLALPDRRLLGARIDRIQADPAVCAAAARQRLRFVVTGGDAHIWGYYENPAYAGIDATVLNGTFTPVAAAGPYVLRAVPACVPG